jgi:serine/threonine-protein kinase
VELDAPRVLGQRYRLIEPLGNGGMGTVWRGFDQVLNRRVAIKLVDGGSAFRARVQAEAQAAARLSHPHIAAVHDYGTDGAAAFVVMELVEGETLAAALADGPLPWRAAVEVCAQVAGALAAAHARGFAHRDMSPANIMLTPTGAKVVDFGVAAVIGARAVDGPAGRVIGTPAYLAPERLAAGVVGPAADVYALGVVLYQSITGDLPWAARSTADLVEAHRRVPARPLTGVPAEVADLCAACLAKDPADRPSSARVAVTLGAAVGMRVPAAAGTAAHGGGTAMTGPTGTRLLTSGSNAGPQGVPLERRTLAAALAAVGVFVLVAAVAWSVWPDRRGAAASAACAVSYTVRSEWRDGATVEVKVSNAGTAELSTWELGFALRNGVRLRSGWNGRFAQDGARVRVSAPDYGARLPVGGSASVGFNLSGSGPGKAELREFTLNGTRCD